MNQAADDKLGARTLSLRERRYAIRFPLAADVELLDLETGSRVRGTTTDFSLGGCFISTNKPLPRGTRIRAFINRNSEKVEVLAAVRTIKDKVGMGIEFMDLDDTSHQILQRWIDDAKKSR